MAEDTADRLREPHADCMGELCIRCEAADVIDELRVVVSSWQKLTAASLTSREASR